VEKNSNSAQVFWVALGSLSAFAFGLVSAALLSRYFSKTEYGTYRQILYVYNTLLVIFTAGLPRVFAYFLPRYNMQQGKDVVFKLSRVLFITGLAFSLFIFTFSGLISQLLKNPELSRGLKFFSPVPMLLLPTLGIEGIFATYKRTIYLAIYNIVTRILMIAFIVLPVVILKGSYLYAIYGWIIVSIITLILAYFFKGIPFKGIKPVKSDLSLREVLRYSLPLVTASIASIAIKSADQFYISRFFGTEVFAEYSNGFMEIPFIQMITGATATVLMPIFSKIVHDKSDINELIDLWQKSLKKSVILIYPMVIFFLFYSHQIIVLLYSDTYAISAEYFDIAIILNFFNVIIFAPLLFSLGETKFYAWLHIIQAITVWTLQYLMVIIFHSPFAIAILSVSLNICNILVSLWYSARIIGVPLIKLFPVGRFSLIAMHSIIAVIITQLILKLTPEDLGNFFILIIAVSIYIVLLFLLSIPFGIRYWGLLIPFLKTQKR
jgi:O-antigen/teichoic acid export membrane protein